MQLNKSLYKIGMMGVATLFYPSLATEDFVLRIHKPIMIQLDRHSPAFIALEEVHREFTEDQWLSSSHKEQISLTVNEKKFVLPNVDEEKTEEVIILEPLKLSRIDQLERPRTYQSTEGSFEQQNLEGVWEGQLHLSSGLHYTNEERFEVWRRSEGIYIDRGTVEPTQGRFQINLTGSKGEMIVRMIDKNNLIIGEDVMDLSTLRSPSNVSQNRRQTPRVTIKPNKGIVAQLKDLYGREEKNLLKNAKVSAYYASMKMDRSDTDQFESRLFENGSWTVARADVAGFIPSTYLQKANQAAEAPLMPLEMFDSMIELVSSQIREDEDKLKSGVIWGRVEINGKPLAGVSIESLALNGGHVIYFNELMLPDSQLRGTSSTGIFAILGLDSGFHSLIGKRGDKTFAHVNTVVDEGAVSFVKLETQMNTKQTIIRTYDAFSGLPVAAELNYQGLEESLIIKQSGQYLASLTPINRLSFIYSQPDDLDRYIPAVYQTDDSNGYVHLPQIDRTWVNQILRLARIQDLPETTLVVGFVPDDSYTLHIPGEIGRAQILYFDHEGRLSSEPLKGGGFLIYGLPSGYREIAVAPDNNPKLLSRVLDVDERLPQVLIFRNH